MSKCWYCNNELTTVDNPKHFGICNKCYDEMFKSSDTIIRSFTNKITDLEAKLEESEKEKELDNSFWKQECDSLQKTLVEKDKEIEKLNACVDFYKSYYISFKGKVIDELEKVKRYIDEKAYYLEEENFGIEINEYIDTQINDLKGESGI